MKAAIYLLAAIQAAVLIALVVSVPGEAKVGIAGALVALVALVSFAFFAPAVLLARRGKSLPFALALACVPLVVAGIVAANLA